MDILKKSNIFSSELEIRIACYIKDDWDRFLEIIDDATKMQNTWEEWYNEYSFAKSNFKRLGYEVVDVVVNLDKLIEFCKDRGIKNNSAARSEFVQQ